MRIIDTHLHIRNKEEFSLPWLDGEGEVLNRTYSLEDYKNALEPDKGYEVEAAVYVEVDCARRDKEKENLFIAGCCANPGQMFAGDVYPVISTRRGLRSILINMHPNM